ncbi:Uncharacterised protein [Vibrio cholerae]|uniref:Uncharacterized protein n=1 Tax=Vibrio cholerae TaxID=666 RepID=A0A655P2R1_VIBCL|nr:Uncharacterised protein [Vibrio cholerae]
MARRIGPLDHRLTAVTLCINIGNVMTCGIELSLSRQYALRTHIQKIRRHTAPENRY